MGYRKLIEKRISEEETALRECVECLLKSGDPATWPRLQRQYMAQAFVPKDGRLNPEHAKGLRLMGMFYPGRTTFARAPDWVKELAGNREKSFEHIAERIRADLGKLVHRHREGRIVCRTI